jgi:uncharacterized membrane protein
MRFDENTRFILDKNSQLFSLRRKHMKNPLDSLWGTVVSGLILTLVLYVFANNFLGAAPSTIAMEPQNAIFRWIHFMAGVMWIGLLYYFNFVQVPALKAAAADGTAGGITKHIAPRALLYFRWAAAVTWVAGAALLGSRFVSAFTLQPEVGYIGLGAWLGTIMLFNVWVLIWPMQKKILGIVQASDEDKNKARRVAFLASRTNTMLSLPLLFFMGVGVHGF